MDYIEWFRTFKGAGCKSRIDYAKAAEKATAHLDEDAIEEAFNVEVKRVMEATLLDVDRIISDMASRLQNEGETVAATSLHAANAIIRRTYGQKCTLPDYLDCQCSICTAPGLRQHNYRIWK